MIKYQTSRRAGIQDFLCPFTDMYITQGANGAFSHKGTMANDVRGRDVGVRYPYYAPCDVKCMFQMIILIMDFVSLLQQKIINLIQCYFLLLKNIIVGIVLFLHLNLETSILKI